MDKDREAFQKELLRDFKIEAAEHLQAFVDALLSLEKDFSHPDKQHIVESVFREVHSMKGAARAVNLIQIERICVSLERVFYEIKKETLAFSKPMFDVFFKTIDLLETMVKEIDMQQKSVSENHIKSVEKTLLTMTEPEGNQPEKPGQKSETTHGSKRNEEKPSGEFPQERPAAKVSSSNIEQKETNAGQPPTKSAGKQGEGEETVRVATAKLYEMLRMAEELITIKNEFEHHAGLLQHLSQQLNAGINNYEARVAEFSVASEKDIRKDVAEEKEQLGKSQQDLDYLADNMYRLKRQTDRSVADLILSIRKSLLQPFSSLFVVVPRIVRDLSKEYDKEVQVDLKGAETEIDRRILEQMKDPLIHLIRNCIDHGIERRSERQKKNKPETGKLQIHVSNETGKKIKLEIKDDGGGLDPEKLVQAAIKAGVLTSAEAEKLNEEQTLRLLFASGVTTSPFITDISGRGLGMAIVAEKIDGLGGKIDVKSEFGKGTVFTITLPQTLSTFRGVLVKAAETLFLIPTHTVLKAVLIKPEEIDTIESKQIIRLNNENVGMVSLSDVLGIPKRHTTRKRGILHGLVFQHAQKKLALLVEDLLGEHEGVVKPLGAQLKHMKNIFGASLLGDGKIVPVLNMPEVLSKAYGKRHLEAFAGDEMAEETGEDQPVKLLVVEDSITVRNMLRNYLDSAGFSVITAVDGQEAYEQLQNQDFDIVVSDIEMPRMNGFELTERIRSAFGQIPVVLVTALESSDDRKRGMNAGANAYIVKSSFEKGNLIDTIKRLI